MDVSTANQMNDPVDVWATRTDIAADISVVDSRTKYPFTKEHADEKAAVELPYDGTVGNVRQQLVKSIELRAIDANRDVAMILI